MHAFFLLFVPVVIVISLPKSPNFDHTVTLALTSSIYALLGSRVSRRFCTPSHETAISGIIGCGVLLQFGMSVVFS